MRSKWLLTTIICVLSQLSTAKAQLPSYVPEESLIAWWGMNGNGLDDGPRFHHGIVAGATPTINRFGIPDQAMFFNGNDAYIAVASATDLNLLESFSISAWIRLDVLEPRHRSSDQMFIISKNRCVTDEGTWQFQVESVDGEDYELHYNGDPCFCLVSMGGSASHPGYRRWAHVLITYDDAAQLLTYFLDGVAVWSSNQFRYANRITDFDVLIGADRSCSSPESELTGLFRGSLDDLGLWSRALNQSEVRQLFDGDHPCYRLYGDSILGYRNTETHQVVTYALRNYPSVLEYQWIATGGYLLGETSNHYCDVIWGYDEGGTVCCIVSDNSSCYDTICVDVSIRSTTTGGIAGEDPIDITMSVRPNPTSDMIEVSSVNASGATSYSLLDVTGRVLQQAHGQRVRMSVEDVPSGVYHMVMMDGMGLVVAIERVVVQR